MPAGRIENLKIYLEKKDAAGSQFALAKTGFQAGLASSIVILGFPDEMGLVAAFSVVAKMASLVVPTAGQAIGYKKCHYVVRDRNKGGEGFAVAASL